MHFLRCLCLLLLALLVPAVPGLAAERVLLGPSGAARAVATASAILPLEAKARQAGTVKVIVGLRVPFAPAASLSIPVARQQATEIATAATALELRYATAIARSPEGFRAYAGIPFAALDVTAAELRALAADPEVISITENILLRPSLAESTRLIRAPEVWSGGDTGKNQVIAVIDSGVDTSHPMLAGKVVSEACYSRGRWCPGSSTSATGPGSGRPCPYFQYGACRHGTHVAGIAAGRSANGFSGVAPDAQIIAIQVFSPSKGSASAYLGDVLAGVERVHELRGSFNIAAANLSLGSPAGVPMNCDQTWRPMTAAFAQLRADGIAVVVASGNDGSIKGIDFPACISTAVSVGAVSDGDWGPCSIGSTEPVTTAADKVACYSNASRVLSLLAPGSAITSALPGGGYGTLHGTSMAAPHVAGAFALLRSHAPDADVEKLLSTLRETGRKVVDYRDSSIVTPRIDVKAASDSLGGGSDGKIALDLALLGNGRGTVSFAPKGSYSLCTASCSNRYAAGTVVTLTAAARAPAKFTGWAGACTGSGNCSVTLDVAKSVTARFEAPSTGPRQVLKLSLLGSGAPMATLTANDASDICTKECSPTFPRDSLVRVAATPPAGTEFLFWTGACTGRKTTCSIRMLGPQALTAQFRKLPVFRLAIDITGSGSVEANVAGKVTPCEKDCTLDVVSGSAVTLTATAGDGASFAGWSGACRGPKSSCVFTLAAPMGVAARFD